MYKRQKALVITYNNTSVPRVSIEGNFEVASKIRAAATRYGIPVVEDNNLSQGLKTGYVGEEYFEELALLFSKIG